MRSVAIDPPERSNIEKSCYIFTPQIQENDRLAETPNKRRKLFGREAQRASDDLPFVPLFAGKEDDILTRTRYESFNDLWDPLETSLNVRGGIDPIRRRD